MPNVGDSTGNGKQAYLNFMAGASDKLIDRGYSTIPTNGKRPYEDEWWARFYPKATMRERVLGGDNIGLPLGFALSDGTRLIGLDVDVEALGPSYTIRDILEKAGLIGPVRYGRENKFLMLVRVPPWDSFSRDINFVRVNGHGAEKCGIQILGRSKTALGAPKQAVVMGVHPDTGKLYHWEGVEGDGGRQTILDMNPDDWPLERSLDVRIELIAEALGKLGWSMTGGGSVGGDGFDGKEGLKDDQITDRIVEAVRGDFKRGVDELSGLGAGQRRGTKAFNLGLAAGFAIKAGKIDLDEARAEVQAAMPDNTKDMRQFDNGVAASTGGIYAAQAAVDWKAAAAAEGVDLGAGQGAAAGGAGLAGAQASIDGYRLALNMLHGRLIKRNVLRHGSDTSYCAFTAEAATTALAGQIFRGAAGDIVRVRPFAGTEGLGLDQVKEDGDFDLKSLPTPKVREELIAEPDCKVLIADAVQCWQKIKIPKHDPANGVLVTWAPDGETVGWSMVGKAVEGVMTKKWALREGYNPDRASWLEDDDGWQTAPPPKGDLMKVVIGAIRGGSGTVGMPRLKSVSTAPSFGREGRLLVEDGPQEVSRGEVVYVTQGALRGKVAMMPFEEARREVMAFLRLFPVADDVSEAVLLSLILTLIARSAFPLPPAYIIDAPEYGSGKTYAALAMALLAGQGHSIVPCGADGADEELAKRFETTLMVGMSGMLLLDDAPGGKMPNFSTLRTYLSATTPEMRIRRFGKNDDAPTVRIDRTTLVVTGNAVKVSKDMIRRVLRCYLNVDQAGAERGWRIETAREGIEGLFTSPKAWGRLLGALLTVLDHNWRNRPCKAPPTQNYESWSRVVREAVMTVTGKDIDESRALLDEMDADKQDWQEKLGCVCEVAGGVGSHFTVADLVKAINAGGGGVGFGGFGGAEDETPAQRLAALFENRRDRTKHGLSLALRSFIGSHRDGKFEIDGAVVCLKLDSTKSKSHKTGLRYFFKAL